MSLEEQKMITRSKKYYRKSFQKKPYFEQIGQDGVEISMDKFRISHIFDIFFTKIECESDSKTGLDIFISFQKKLRS